MSKFNITIIQGKDIVLDISQLVSDEALYINATHLSKQFGKDLSNYTRRKSFKEYFNVLNSVKTTELKLMKTKEGNNGGTYIHNDLVIHFLRWLDVNFAVHCDMYIKQKLQEVHNDKLVAEATAKANKANEVWVNMRVEAVTTRNKLTKAIEKFCEYASSNRATPYKANKCPYYISLTSLVYESLGLKKPKGAKVARDIFSGAVVEKIEYLEDMLINLLHSHIQQDTEYHEAIKSIKELINYEVLLIDEVA